MARTKKNNAPAWKRDHPALLQVRALEPLALLEVDAHDTRALNDAVDQWEALDDGVKEYLHARMAYNGLIIADAQRRLSARIEDHLGSIRTGTRLTVEELKGLAAAPAPEAFGDDEFDDDGDFVGDDDEDFDDEEDEDFAGDAPANDDAAAIEGLDGDDVHNLFDRMESGEQVIEAPGSGAPAPAPKRKKKKPAKKRGALRRTDNGAGKPVTPEVLDADGFPVAPPPS
jgi:hypothetical protein